MNRLRLIGDGRAFTMCALVTDGDCAVAEFLDRLCANDRNAGARMAALIRHVCDQGFANLHEDKCRSVGGKVFELKDRKSGARLFFCYDAKRRRIVILLSAYGKNAKREQAAAIHRAQGLCAKYAGLSLRIEGEEDVHQNLVRIRPRKVSR